MHNLKLTIDLLPKGAWGKDFSITLPKRHWNQLRRATYKAADYQCEICGAKPETLFEKRNQVKQWEMKAPLLDELGIDY